MNFKNIVVHVTLGQGSPARVRFAVDLAQRLGALLIGAAGDEPSLNSSGKSVAWLWEALEVEAQELLGNLERNFRRSAGAVVDVKWRSALGPVPALLMQAAILADLIVVGRDEDNPQHHRLTVECGDLALQAGRPILVVPTGYERLAGDRAVVGWKNVREGRRALADAIPLLALFDETVVLAVGDENDAVSPKEAVAFLSGHGLKARSEWRPRHLDGAGYTLLDFAEEAHAGLIVAGAYGHSRLREWAFGGVTQALMMSADIPCFFSH
jgi:nucleotide-binding universal stress UspA family protein